MLITDGNWKIWTSRGRSWFLGSHQLHSFHEGRDLFITVTIWQHTVWGSEWSLAMTVGTVIHTWAGRMFNVLIRSNAGWTGLGQKQTLVWADRSEFGHHRHWWRLLTRTLPTNWMGRFFPEALDRKSPVSTVCWLAICYWQGGQSSQHINTLILKWLILYSFFFEPFLSCTQRQNKIAYSHSNIHLYHKHNQTLTLAHNTDTSPKYSITIIIIIKISMWHQTLLHWSELNVYQCLSLGNNKHEIQYICM